MKAIGIEVVDKKGDTRYLERHGNWYGIQGVSFIKNARQATTYNSVSEAQNYLKDIKSKVTKRVVELENKRVKYKKKKTSQWDVSYSGKLRRISHEKSQLKKFTALISTAKAGEIDVPITLYKKTRKIQILDVPKNKSAHTCNYCGVKLLGVKYVNVSYDTKICPLCIESLVNRLQPEMDKISEDIKKEYKGEMFYKAL